MKPAVTEEGYAENKAEEEVDKVKSDLGKVKEDEDKELILKEEVYKERMKSWQKCSKIYKLKLMVSKRQVERN